MPARLKTFDLPEGYRPGPGDPLLSFLNQNSDQPIAVSLSALRRVDTLVVQLLLVAAADWRRRGGAFGLTGLRPDLDDALQGIGAGDDLLKRGVPA